MLLANQSPFSHLSHSGLTNADQTGNPVHRSFICSKQYNLELRTNHHKA